MAAMKRYFYEESDGNGNVSVHEEIEATSFEDARRKFESMGYEEFSAPYQAGGHADNPVTRSNDGAIGECPKEWIGFCWLNTPRGQINISRCYNLGDRDSAAVSYIHATTGEVFVPIIEDNIWSGEYRSIGHNFQLLTRLKELGEGIHEVVELCHLPYSVEEAKKIRRQIEDRLRKDRFFFTLAFIIADDDRRHEWTAFFSPETAKRLKSIVGMTNNIKIENLLDRCEEYKKELRDSNKEVSRLASLLYKSGVSFHSNHPEAVRFGHASMAPKDMKKAILEG